jgi:tetratricopeptide (TPR) repeat protein
MNDKNEGQITDLGYWLLEKINLHEDGNQARLARGLGNIHRSTIYKWIRGQGKISRRFLLKLKQRWDLSEQEFNTLRSLNGAEIIFEEQANEPFRAASQLAHGLHNLPFPPNPFFTGRKKYLELLDQYFKEGGSVVITQPISISGLGGVGKTQLALAYAHSCYFKVYRTILWVNAANRATLEDSYLSLAYLLELLEKDEHEVGHIVRAVKTWLEEHTDWLLIFDNADDLQLARFFLPTTPRGHILLTTRSQIVGNIAVQIEVEAMEPSEGLIFLLRRSGVLKAETELETIAPDIRNAARQLVETLVGHPLALDQAGSYIEETRISFATYIRLYTDQRLILLNERGLLGDEHPETVAITFEVSFQRACELYSTAADVLRFCSFLHPDAIPEELLSQDESLKLNPLAFNKAIAALRRYSLIKRNAEKKMLSVHRLVQAVIKDRMNEEFIEQWAKRTVLLVNIAFPYVEYANWSYCEILVSHVFISYELIQRHHIVIPESAHLLNKAGYYLYLQDRYEEAEQLLNLALSIQSKLEQDHPDKIQVLNDKVQILNDLGLLYNAQHKYEQAESLLQEALTIQEQLNDPNPAQSLWILGLVYFGNGKYKQAEQLYQRALMIREEMFGIEDYRIATVLHNLALLYEHQMKEEQAEQLYQRALAIQEKQLGSEHPDLARTLECLALLYSRQGRYEEAEKLHLRTLAMKRRLFGREHFTTAMELNNLAVLYHNQGKSEEAKKLYLEALAISKQYLKRENDTLNFAILCSNLAALYHSEQNYQQAKQFYQKAWQIQKKLMGIQHPTTVKTRHHYNAVLEGRDWQEDIDLPEIPQFDQVKIEQDGEAN